MLIALIYLHIKQSSMIFQRDIKTVINLLIASVILVVGTKLFTLLITMIVFSVNQHRMARSASIGALAFWPLLYDFSIWVIVVIAYAKFFSGLRKVAYFSKTDTVDLSLRKKIREILLETSEQKCMSQGFKMFLQTNHEDPLVEEIRSGCGSVGYYSSLQIPDKEWEKLKDFAEKLKE